MGRLVKNTVSLGLVRESKRIQKKANLAVKRGLEAIRSEIVPLTPVKTSRLKGSILGRGVEKDDSIFKVEDKGRKIIGVIGTNVPYAKFVEFGTSKMAPRRFFSTGVQNSIEKVRSILLVTLRS